MVDPETSAQKPWPWMRIALVLSLAANLLIVGIILGSALGRDGPGGRGGDRAGGERDLGPLPFVMALEPEDRRDLGQALRGAAEPLRQNRQALRARFEALLGALRAPEFDRNAISALISEQRNLAVSRQQMGETLLLDHLEAMSVTDRQRYADRLDRSLRRGN